MANTSADITKLRSRGFVAPGFEAVQNAFDAMLLLDPAYSGQVAVSWKGDLVVDLVGGADADEDSITGVFSVSKGAAALVLATLVNDGSLDLDQTVARYWPEFAQENKGSITVRQALTHQAGLVNVDGGMTVDVILDSQKGAALLAQQFPHWRPGTAIGYHGITVGFIAEELVRRITGETLQDRFERLIRAPRDIDFYLGLPESEDHRYRPVLPMQPTPAQAAEIAATPGAPDSLAALMYNAVHRDFSPADGPISPNQRRIRANGHSALAGVGSARGIAQMYSAALGYVGEPLLSDHTIREVSQQQAWGLDRLLGVNMSFGILFMKPHPSMEFGSYRAFGHDGAGGALGFADPMYDLGFGYIPTPMSYPGGADEKAVRMSHIARRCIHGLS